MSDHSCRIAAEALALNLKRAIVHRSGRIGKLASLLNVILGLMQCRTKDKAFQAMNNTEDTHDD
jgi:hypothetical protein